VVFIGPYEHHSNELPWRESIADVITIGEDGDGHIDLVELEDELRRYAARPLKIGSFSAASNVTGIGTDTRAVAALLHRYGACRVLGLRRGRPLREDRDEPGRRRPRRSPRSYKDAVFLSPHKFIGGPGTPGVLVAKRHLFATACRRAPGGGTVQYVNPEEHRYLTDPEQREEGGTPAIIESIRAGLVFQLKEAVGVADHPGPRGGLHPPGDRVVGAQPQPGHPRQPRRLAACRSCRSWSATGDAYLHHNFVVALLNDLFGIQARGGCSCAGPYGHRLLGIDLATSKEFEREIVRGCEGIKPGWVRVNFNYFPEFGYLPARRF
jgi:selenocysteine lyase/cysteine desulfurase